MGFFRTTEQGLGKEHADPFLLSTRNVRRAASGNPLILLTYSLHLNNPKITHLAYHEVRSLTKDQCQYVADTTVAYHGASPAGVRTECC